MNRMMSAKSRSLVGLGAAALLACATPRNALAAEEGGLYIAGYRSSFERAAEQGLSRNPPGQRFFVLALPPHAAALTTAATTAAAAVRDRVVASGGLLYVCQRDIDNGSVDAATREWSPCAASRRAAATPFPAASVTFPTRTATSCPGTTGR